MPLFKNKPQVINAEQFLPPDKVPQGVFGVHVGRENCYTGTISVSTISGFDKLTIKDGDWVVLSDDARDRNLHIFAGAISGDRFNDLWEPVTFPEN